MLQTNKVSLDLCNRYYFQHDNVRFVHVLQMIILAILFVAYKFFQIGPVQNVLILTMFCFILQRQIT